MEEVMSRQKKYSLPQVTEQASKLIDTEWEEQVLKRLPPDTEEEAFKLRAFVRCREIASVGDLLRALLAYVLCVSSFRQLGSWAVLLGIANISDTAWRKRLKSANGWLLWLLGALLATIGANLILYERQKELACQEEETGASLSKRAWT
jgi:hypothetical protein